MPEQTEEQDVSGHVRSVLRKVGAGGAEAGDVDENPTVRRAGCGEEKVHQLPDAEIVTSSRFQHCGRSLTGGSNGHVAVFKTLRQTMPV